MSTARGLRVGLAVLVGGGVLACGANPPRAPDPAPTPVVEPPPAPEPHVAEPPDPLDPRDPAGAVRFLRALCERAQAGDHDWVRPRVQLVLNGIHTINNESEDPIVAPHDTRSVESFEYTRYCRTLPAPDTALRAFTVDAESASGLVDFGLPHRVVFDLSTEPPRLVTLDAQVEARPMPPRRKVRTYLLEAPPFGFTRHEPTGSSALRRRVIGALTHDPRCVEDYVSRYNVVARIKVQTGRDGKTSVQPFQLVRSSLLACLKTQFAALDGLSPTPTSAIIEILVPMRADEIDDDTPTLMMGPR